jgi:hypothetical protein
MQHVRSAACAALVTVMLASHGSIAGAQADTSKIDTSAVNALVRMGTYLRTLTTFQVSAVVTTEDVNDDGIKLQSTSNVSLLAQRPNRLFADITNDRQPRQLYYDGKTFTLWAPKLKFYAQVPAPSTIIALVDTLDTKFELEVPFVDLFRWGTSDSSIKEIDEAIDVGPAMVQGVTCQHYAFRQDGLDWQIWIQKGAYPLPHKIVLTTTTDDARPQHQSVYTWNLAPSFNDKAFAFTVPADAKKITLADVNKMRTVAKKNGGGGKQ